MTDQSSGLVPVETAVVLQTLVERMLDRVEAWLEEEPPERVAAVLEASELGVAGSDPKVEATLRHAGYLARLVEREMFEPAKEPAAWISPLLAERFAVTGSWDEAVASLCVELARAEPLGKPSPEDPAAASWRVPGPGGHVRHFLARRTIEEHLRDVEAPAADDPAELKRPWLYGFLVCSCEEALPQGAALGGER